MAEAMRSGQVWVEIFPSLGTFNNIIVLAIGVLIVLTAIGGWATLSWRKTRYRVRNGSLEHEVGILFRQQRHARLDRLQAVDVVQPLLGRIFGLSELRLEVAGGAGSDIRLQYLKDVDAERLRNVLLAQAAGVDYTGSEAPAAPERQLMALSPGRLIGSLLLNSDTIIAVLMLVGVAVAVVFAPGAIFTAIPIVLASASTVWARFSRGFNFTVAVSPDGLRLRHGLLETRTQTVPPGRVQAVQLRQPLLWRARGWWLVRVNVAGYGVGGGGPGNESTVLMPAATRDEAYLLLAQVLPDLGTRHPVALLDQGIGWDGPAWPVASDAGPSFVGAPPRSVWLDPISWRRNGFAVTTTALLLRSGRLTRRLAIVPHARTQSLGLTQGPVQRRLKLASMVVHSTPGPVRPVAAHLDQEIAGRLLMDQANRARLARSATGPEQWMRAQAPRPVDLIKRG